MQVAQANNFYPSVNRKRGRKAKAGDRHPCGKLKQDGPPVHAVARRAEAAGCSMEEAQKRPEAGYALGQLLMRQVIDIRRHDAGQAFRTAWMRWASLAGLPPHQVMQRTPGGAQSDVDPEEWDKAKAAFAGAADALFACEQPRLVWAAVETVVMDDVLPPLLESRWVAVAALRAGLEALARHYRMPERAQAS